MPTSDGQPKITGNDPPFRAPASGFLRQILTAVVSIAVLVAAFALSLVIFAALAAIALIAGGYVWWRTRALRRQMRERPPGGRVIDGEVMRDSSTTDPD